MKAGYIPPLSREGDPLVPGQEGYLAPGIRGYAIEEDGRVYIPLIISEVPGIGRVGDFLDALDARCVIVNVRNIILRGMLERRGWTHQTVVSDEGEVDHWTRT